MSIPRWPDKVYFYPYVGIHFTEYLRCVFTLKINRGDNDA